MRVPGQYWWGWLLVLPVEVAFWAGLGWLAWPPPFPRDQVVLMLAIYCVICLMFTGLIVGASVTTRRRYRAALAAVTAAISTPNNAPTARGEAPMVALPVLAVEPVTLLWQFRSRPRWITGLGLGVIVAEVYRFLSDLIPALSDKGTHVTWPLSRLVGADILLGVVIALVVPIAVVGIVACIVQPILARPFGVVARDDGIEMRRIVGGRRRLRWEDVKLFQYTYDGDRYYLFGRQTYITWQKVRSPAYRGLRPVGITPGDLEKREAVLHAVVTQRSGLELQTAVRLGR